MNRKSFTRIFIGSIVLLAAAVVFLQLSPQLRSDRTRSDQEYIALLRQVITIVRKNYVEPVEEGKLVKGAITGMLASLDPHSVYLPPEPFKEMQINTMGAFGGVGIEITVKDGKLTVIAPIEDTPAYRAGIRPGDHIALIDGTPTRDLTINDAVKRMRGPKNTRVTLTIIRSGELKPLIFPLIRDIIQVKSLRFQTLAPGFGYLRIMQFQARTGTDLSAALDTLKQQNGGSLKGLVLDLRNNPGGLLDQAVNVANHFLGNRPDNALIVYTRGRDESSRHDFNASIGEKEPPYPLVVLINGGSASASEIIAGALQDHGRAVIMGTQSFGKGSVQNIIDLPRNAGLLLTTAKYYTPKGRSIQAKGITPDIVVENLILNGKTRPEAAPFREKDLDRHISDGTAKPGETAPSTPSGSRINPPASEGPLPHGMLTEAQVKKDYQLLRALDLLSGWNVLRTEATSR